MRIERSPNPGRDFTRPDAMPAPSSRYAEDERLASPERHDDVARATVGGVHDGFAHDPHHVLARGLRKTNVLGVDLHRTPKRVSSSSATWRSADSADGAFRGRGSAIAPRTPPGVRANTRN